MRRTRPFPLLAFALAPLATLAGCGSENFSLAPVSGRVTIDGKPVAGARVAFEPIGGSSRPVPGPEAMAITDADGRYTLYTTISQQRGAVVGPCRVRIWTLPTTQTDVIADDRDPNYDTLAEVKALKEQAQGEKKEVNRPTGLIPKRFNDATELKFDVPPDGTDKADFAISWK